MKIIDVEQGTPEWLQARVGIPTASAFDRIITSKTLKLSAQAAKYRYELIAEWTLGHPLDSGTNAWMNRGSDLEAEARNAYEFLTENTVEQVGFVTTDDGLIGCSPDGLVGDDGGVEIKCPGAAKHVENMRSHDDYRIQIYGCMWICERAWWDFVSYCPGFSPVVRRVERDDEIIGKIEKAVRKFVDDLQAQKEIMVNG